MSGGDPPDAPVSTSASSIRAHRSMNPPSARGVAPGVGPFSLLLLLTTAVAGTFLVQAFVPGQGAR